MSASLAFQLHPGRRDYSASDKAVYLMSQGTKLANLYAESAQLHNDPLAIAKGDILRESARAQNIYHSQDQINRQTGELFEGYGTLADGLCSRLSKDYLTKSSRRARKMVKTTIDKQKPLLGQRWRFMTLTPPFLRTNVEKAFKIKTYAETLFKKRPLWTQNVAGAFIAEELKIGTETRDVQTHWHVHTHILMLSTWVDQWRWADAWTDCVEKACKKFGVEFLMSNLKSNRLMTDIRDVRKYAKKHAMGFDDAVNELVKYCTKGSEYEKVPRLQIVEIDNALHGRQMIKSYGIFNQQHGRKQQSTKQDTSLDVKSITDEKVKLVEAKKRESLAEMGAKMIASGQRAEWLAYLADVFEFRREFKVDYLMRKNPHATFWTLEGHRFYGVSQRPPRSNVLAFRI